MKIILLSKKQRQISNSYFTGWQGYTKCTKVGLCTLTGPSTTPPPIISLSIYQFILNKTVINKYTRKLTRRNVCLLHSFKVRERLSTPSYSNHILLHPKLFAKFTPIKEIIYPIFIKHALF